MLNLYEIHIINGELRLIEKENLYEYNIDETDINKVDEILENKFGLKDNLQEHEYIYATRDNGEAGLFLLSIGNEKSCDAYPKELLEFLLLYRAKKFISLHNHPSGNIHPSSGDYDSLRTILKIGNMIDVELYDFVVIGSNKYYSVRENDGNLLFSVCEEEEETYD